MASRGWARRLSTSCRLSSKYAAFLDLRALENRHSVRRISSTNKYKYFVREICREITQLSVKSQIVYVYMGTFLPFVNSGSDFYFFFFFFFIDKLSHQGFPWSSSEYSRYIYYIQVDSTRITTVSSRLIEP